MTITRLRAWRESLRLTQRDAAHLLGVPKRTYEQWEGKNGHPHPLLDLACKWVTQAESLKFVDSNRG